ncbi:MAG: class I SAM-dependent methyltransferase [Vitreoscilla sp.]|nr:class I SAM-dependent methyltransferase [Vitreoscilla sp.]
MTMTPSRQQISAAAHEEVPHANPLSPAQMEQLVDLALRWSPSTAIDIGCGPGAFAVGLASRAPVSVLAIDLNSAFLDRGKSTAKSTPLVGNIAFLERSLKDDEGAHFDVVVCIGSSGAVGSPRGALRRCKELMSPHGVLVFAELVWTSQPPDGFLDFLGIERAYYWLASEGESVFSRCGLSIEHEIEASPSSWESYERAVLDGRLKIAASLPPELGESIRSRATTWYASFELHGRHHLGFNAYVARHAEA